MCTGCGASLHRIESAAAQPEAANQPREYDHHYGETDLLERNLQWRGATYAMIGLTTLILLFCMGSSVLAMTTALRTFGMLGPSELTPAIDDPSVQSVQVTATPRPTLNLPTVTNAPPTMTMTPTPAPTDTPGPCMQEVLAGDSLIAIVARCGHRDIAIIDVVLEINDLEAPERIQSGQILEIPWPTPTSDPSIEETVTPGETVTPDEVALVPVQSDSEDTVSSFAESLNPDIVATATLRPGVTWHVVRPEENIISVAYQYGADLKILSELNPEVTFSQCDFGLATGGPQCVVQIYEGQWLRVPAPTPTPTLSPTPSGSETPTPTATATFNAPTALSPGDRSLFTSDAIITLRWIGSGTLAADQVYRVIIEDMTSGETYNGDTTDLFYIVPEQVQGADDRRHEYRWTVSVIDINQPDRPYFTTEPRTFVWESRR